MSKLTVDLLPIEQKYFIVSFLKNENDVIEAFKIRGVYPSMETAKEGAQKIYENDKLYDIHIADMGKWIPHNVDKKYSESVEYLDKRLNDLIEGQEKLVQQGKEEMLKHKKELEENTKKSSVNYKTHEDNITEKLATHSSTIIDENVLESEIKELKAKDKDLQKEYDKVNAEELSVENKLDKLKQLYKDINSE